MLFLLTYVVSANELFPVLTEKPNPILPQNLLREATVHVLSI